MDKSLEYQQGRKDAIRELLKEEICCNCPFLEDINCTNMLSCSFQVGNLYIIQAANDILNKQ